MARAVVVFGVDSVGICSSRLYWHYRLVAIPTDKPAAPTFPPIKPALAPLSLIARLCDFYPQAPHDLLLAIERLGSEQVLPKGHLLEAPNTATQQLYFLASGSAEQFWEEGEVERTSYLWTPGDVMCRANALMSGTADVNGIRVVNSSTVLSFDYAALQALHRTQPSFTELALAVTQHYMMCIGTLGSILTRKSPRERYEALVEARPEWVASFSQTRIASLLNMRRETLSRLRAER